MSSVFASAGGNVLIRRYCQELFVLENIDHSPVVEMQSDKREHFSCTFLVPLFQNYSSFYQKFCISFCPGYDWVVLKILCRYPRNVEMFFPWGYRRNAMYIYNAFMNPTVVPKLLWKRPASFPGNFFWNCWARRPNGLSRAGIGMEYIACKNYEWMVINCSGRASASKSKSSAIFK